MTETNTVDVIARYREQKKQVESLATQARQEIQTRYSAALTEAAALRKEFEDAFGETPALPGGVQAFVPAGAPKPQTPAQSAGKLIGGLRRSHAAAVKRGDFAKAMQVAAQLREAGVIFDWAPEESASVTA